MATRALFDPDLLPAAWADVEAVYPLAWFDESLAVVPYEASVSSRTEVLGSGASLVARAATIAGTSSLVAVGSLYNAYPKSALEMAQAFGWGTWNGAYLWDQPTGPIPTVFGGGSSLAVTGAVTLGAAGYLASDTAANHTASSGSETAANSADFDTGSTGDLLIAAVLDLTNNVGGNLFVSKGSDSLLPSWRLGCDQGTNNAFFFVRDTAGNIFEANVTIPSGWCVLVGVLERATNSMNIAVYDPASGLTVGTPVDITTLGNLTRTDKPMRVGNNTDTDVGQIFKIAGLYLGTSAGAAGGAAANIGTATTNLYNYLGRTIADARILGSASLAAVSSGGTTDGVASIAGTSTVSGVGASSATSAATIAGTSTCAATGASTATAIATIAGTAALAAVGQALETATVTIAGTSTVSAQSPVGSSGTATIAGTSTVNAVGASTANASATIAGTSTALAVPEVHATIAGTSSLAATGASLSKASAAIAGSSSLAAAPEVSARIAGTSTLAAVGIGINAATFAIAGGSTANAISVALAQAVAAIHGTSSLVATANANPVGSLSEVGALTGAIVEIAALAGQLAEVAALRGSIDPS